MSMFRVKSIGIVVLSVLLLAGAGCRTVPSESDEAAGVSPRGATERTTGPRKITVQPGTLKMRAPRPSVGSAPETMASAPRPRDPEVAPDRFPTRPTNGAAYRLECGDPVIITLRGPGQSGAVEDVVDERGYIQVPFIGEVKAAGLSSSELETLIHDLYVPDFYRYMTVSVLVPTQRSYYVTGYVNGPGRYPYLAGVTLMQALSAAGGHTNFGNEKKITISRGDQTLGEYNLRDLEKDPSKDIPIEPGDIIKVPRSRI